MPTLKEYILENIKSDEVLEVFLTDITPDPNYDANQFIEWASEKLIFILYPMNKNSQRFIRHSAQSAQELMDEDDTLEDYKKLVRRFNEHRPITQVFDPHPATSH
jgi:TusA-related sulfurtransferase